ncbi:MAG TPA: HAMP domain-containing sensor histidine kinase [Mucilaginibacter sp.]|nr:HAMP domain-containing sensor histidine kinase [Mucilaginibacter sp.]
MTTLATVTLENEMDLILAYKKAIRIGDLLGLSISTQTAFATAVSEVCREVLDKSTDGIASIGTEMEDSRFFLNARIKFTAKGYNPNNEAYEYARKLIPVLETSSDGQNVELLLKIGIPRALKVDRRKVLETGKILDQEGPISAYEEVKLRNADLQQISLKKDIDLAESNYLNQQKNEFLSIASHELNSPLTILHSYSQIALRVEGGNNPVLNGYLKKIESQSGKMAHLIRQLLDISKIENGKISYNKQDVDFKEFIDATSENLMQLVPTHQIHITSEGNCGILIDKMRIEQVLNNVVGNAAKYSEPGTSIYIKAEVTGDMAVVSVSDEGIGMSEEEIRNVFGKFYRSESIMKKYSGLGMGLYISSRIVSDHNGTMNVKSVEGKGSTVSFSLPFA